MDKFKQHKIIVVLEFSDLIQEKGLIFIKTLDLIQSKLELKNVGFLVNKCEITPEQCDKLLNNLIPKIYQDSDFSIT